MATTTSRPSRFVRLARLCNRHRWRTFLCWLLALVVIQVIASSVGTKQISSFRLPGTESQRAYDLLAQHFPAAKGDTDQLVFRARTGTLRDPQQRARIAAALKKVAAQGTVANVTSPFAPGGQLTRDGRIGVASLIYKTSTNDIQPGPWRTSRTPRSPRAARSCRSSTAAPARRSCASATARDRRSSSASWPPRSCCSSRSARRWPPACR